MIRGKF